MREGLPFKPLLLYTVTSGLGDYIIFGDLIRKVETLVTGARCLMAHRGNPHVSLWDYDDPMERFFDVYNPSRLLGLISNLKAARKNGYTVFGFQMAHGSLQSFLFLSFLKKIRALDYTVDFSLINADIITPPKGHYVFDMHLNQIGDMFRVEIPDDFYLLKLPMEVKEEKIITASSQKKIVGIHPWTRLTCSTRVWPFEKWHLLIRELLGNDDIEIIVFGKDERFDIFRTYLQGNLDSEALKRVLFCPSGSVNEYVNVIKAVDIVVTVSTSTVPIGYSLNKKLIILGAATLDTWIPKGENISCLLDTQALLPPSDKSIPMDFCPRVENISVGQVVFEVLRQGI